MTTILLAPSIVTTLTLIMISFNLRRAISGDTDPKTAKSTMIKLNALKKLIWFQIILTVFILISICLDYSCDENSEHYYSCSFDYIIKIFSLLILGLYWCYYFYRHGDGGFIFFHSKDLVSYNEKKLSEEIEKIKFKYKNLNFKKMDGIDDELFKKINIFLVNFSLPKELIFHDGFFSCSNINKGFLSFSENIKFERKIKIKYINRQIELIIKEHIDEPDFSGTKDDCVDIT